MLTGLKSSTEARWIKPEYETKVFGGSCLINVL
jgi:hypothetical protein